MHDDERRRLIGGSDASKDRRRSDRKYDPMDALLWSAVFVIIVVTVVYGVLFLRVAFSPTFEPPDGALQALVLVIPIASGLVLLKRERRNGD